MQKLKSHKGCQKRFKITKNGKVKVRGANRRHILTPKPTKRKRQARNDTLIFKTDADRVKSYLPYH